MHIIQELSPWQKGEKVNVDYRIGRKVLKELIAALTKKEISVMLGARQVGKTTLMMAQIEYLLQEKKVSPQHIYYLSFDYLELRNFKNAIDFIHQFQWDKKSTLYLFLDELQRLKEPGLFLKQLYDLKYPLKIIASGSSALEIKSKIKESFTGRKKVFEIFPLSFSEFVNYKYPGFKPDKSVFHEYLTFGGYPEVVKSNDPEEKQSTLREIINSYFEKDVTDFLSIKWPYKYNDLIKILSSQIGSLVNINELASTLKMNNTTVDDYLYYMNETYLINHVRPFHQNIRKEITKQRKVYFLDFGVRNYFLNNFSDIYLHRDYGFLVENFVYLQLKEMTESEIFFWRTINKTEIDFVTLKNEKYNLYEVKAKSYERLRPVKSFHSFEENYLVDSKTIFCFTEKTVEKDRVSFKNVF